MRGKKQIAIGIWTLHSNRKKISKIDFMLQRMQKSEDWKEGALLQIISKPFWIQGEMQLKHHKIKNSVFPVHFHPKAISNLIKSWDVLIICIYLLCIFLFLLFYIFYNFIHEFYIILYLQHCVWFYTENIIQGFLCITTEQVRKKNSVKITKKSSDVIVQKYINFK